jgi:hypothetical protein
LASKSALKEKPVSRELTVEDHQMRTLTDDDLKKLDVDAGDLQPYPMPATVPERLRLLAVFLELEVASVKKPKFQMQTFADATDIDLVAKADHVEPCQTMCCMAGMAMFMWAPAGYIRWVRALALDQIRWMAYNEADRDQDFIEALADREGGGPSQVARRLLGIGDSLANELFTPGIWLPGVNAEMAAGILRWLADQPGMDDPRVHDTKLARALREQWTAAMNRPVDEAEELVDQPSVP